MNKEEIRIEKNVELPCKRNVCGNYPWREMEVGDSFYTDIPKTFKSIQSFQASLLSSARSYTFTNNLKWKFATRREKDGLRIWRIS